ncbi:cytoskeletal protein CcmA (bactofilin family) [Lutibacter sp. Hel_I_33_5]|uniref:bactofilin family protein n=1 Tax=Lutibacter sp. Hel_I_33_5 TaxID=1566289 RepID=UPI0011ADB21F|nr:polymer-forming cytoskeletal protein [Lutibacter sp. Hel_I_33_5]TVZ56344.1 cytoskeletal protein CcmA (bactofilin family) [Lutibacter sp. Hel_I_33_5]
MFTNKEKTDYTPKTMERNVVAKTTKIIGCDIKSEGDFRIDGLLEGTLTTKGRVIIGVDGHINGVVDAVHADIEGKFSGKLLVHEVLTVKATAKISGDVVINKLSVEPGATFNATCSMKGTVKDLNEGKKAEEKTA